MRPLKHKQRAKANCAQAKHWNRHTAQHSTCEGVGIGIGVCVGIGNALPTRKSKAFFIEKTQRPHTGARPSCRNDEGQNLIASNGRLRQLTADERRKAKGNTANFQRLCSAMRRRLSCGAALRTVVVVCSINNSSSSGTNGKWNEQN